MGVEEKWCISLHTGKFMSVGVRRKEWSFIGHLLRRKIPSSVCVQCSNSVNAKSCIAHPLLVARRRVA
jgi:hypothetical protein